MKESPLVFISHDSRDARLAREFGALLQGASGGTLRSFQSSSHNGWGIEYGREWYQAIMDKLNEATDVVALLTRRSLGRPWILFEAGVAKGHARASVFGVALDLPLEEASQGPFGQFQNCAGDENSLTSLVTELIGRNLGAQPIERAVRHEVKIFLRSLVRPDAAAQTEPIQEERNLVAKIYEEVKLIGGEFKKNKFTKIIGPKLPQEFPLVRTDGGYDATGWLLLLSAVRDDLPWLYETGLDLYRALNSGDRAVIERSCGQVLRSVQLIAHNHWMRSIITETNRELAFRLYYLPDLIEAYLGQLK